MKANEFVKKFGWGEAAAFLSLDSGVEIVYTASFFDDLKRLVESHELVQKFGGLNTAKKQLKKAYDSCSRIICIRKIGFECSYDELSQAIQDIDGVESCMEVSSESN